MEALVEERLSGSGRPRRRWPWALAALAVVWAGWSVFSRLDRVDRQYNSLANSVNNVSHSVNAQVGSIASRVEEILKAQNDLTADYATQLVSADLAENTARFSLRAVPKTYTPGMSVVFLADSGGEVRELEAVEEENGVFTGEMACPLTDSVTLSAVFVTGDTRQTQLLDQYQGLYLESLPRVEPMDLSGLLCVERGENGRFALPEGYITVGGEGASAPAVNGTLGMSRLEEVRVGLFRNFELVTCWSPVRSRTASRASRGRRSTGCPLWSWTWRRGTRWPSPLWPPTSMDGGECPPRSRSIRCRMGRSPGRRNRWSIRKIPWRTGAWSRRPAPVPFNGFCRNGFFDKLSRRR